MKTRKIQKVELLDALKQAIEALDGFGCEDVWYYEAVVKQHEKKVGAK